MTKRISPRILLLAVILISVNWIANAQQQEPAIEYGSISDLKGVKNIYIDTGANIELRNAIVKEIAKNLKNITIANSATEAEVCLLFQTDFLTRYVGTTVSGTATDSGNSTTVQAQSKPQYRKVCSGPVKLDRF